jgi:transcriptional regulator with XRE-family HTH domain
MENFSDWLFTQMQEKDWSQSDLARNAGVTRTAISDVLSGRRKPGPDLCSSIAIALELPPEQVFRVAGILPSTTSDDWADKMAHRISLLTGSRRSMAEKLLDSLLEQEKEETDPGLSAKTAQT